MTPDVDTQSVTVATQLIGLDAKWLQPFDVEGPFNDNLRLRVSSAKSRITAMGRWRSPT